MGEAMLSAVLDKKLSLPQDITVSDVNPERRQYLKEKYSVSVTGDNSEAVKQAEVIVLAIKPQSLPEALPGLKGRLKPSQLVLSIIAGARIATITAGLGHKPVVRVMPNTPARIGQGMSVWTATADVSKKQKEWAGAILGAIGKEIYVDDEDDIDKATAVSGSGPAYFFLFVEVLTEAAIEIGLPRPVAETLAVQTALGSAQLIEQSGTPPAELRRMVTSPGGTTAEALKVLEQGGFAGLFKQAVRAAYDKAKSLGE